MIKGAESLDVGEPQLLHQRKLPKGYDDGLSESEFCTDSDAYFHQQYYEAIDLAINCIQARFEWQSYAVYRNLEQLLLKASQRDITLEFQHARSLFKDDFQPELLRAQLKTFGIEFEHTQREVYGGHNTNEPTIF